MTTAHYKDAIRRKQLPDHRIKVLIDTNVLDRDELLIEGVLTQADLDRIYYESPESIAQNLWAGKYSLEQAFKQKDTGKLSSEILNTWLFQNIKDERFADEEIKSMIETGRLHEQELVHSGVITQDKIDEIFQRPVKGVPIPKSDDWDTIPSLVPGRVDVFILGIANSGKSAFMAGLLYYAMKNGKREWDIDNTNGYLYGDAIENGIGIGLLPEATIEEYMQYMPVSFFNSVNQAIPLSFIEMSGEVFQKSHGKRREQMPPRFLEYLEHDNNKVFILVVDYVAHKNRRGIRSQSSNLEFIVKFLEQQALFGTTKAICILITKWDQSKDDQSKEAAIKFLEEEYLSLYNLCCRVEDKYGFYFEVFRFSLGTFTPRNMVDFIPDSAETIFNWLTSFSPAKSKPPKRGPFGRIFG